MTSCVIAAPSPLAAQTGADVADAGGSVVDAIVAATLTAMCTEPGVCAPGGGGFLTIWEPGSDPLTVDGYMAMPGLGSDGRSSVVRTVSMEYGGGVSTDVGAGSIAVPGGLAALGAAHRRWGRAPWSEVIGAVVDRIAGGFPLPAACRYYLGYVGESIFGDDPASRQALFPDGRLLEAGETVVMADLVATLRRIAEEGPSTMYDGELAGALVADLEGRGSLLTERDLADYRAVLRPALVTEVAAWTIATNPPPAVGGVTLSLILRRLADCRDRRDPNAWVEAQELAFGQRRDQLEGAVDRETAGWELVAGGRRPAASTVSIAAAGDDGTVAASTMSAGYGSGVIPTGTGWWMNNSLGELELNSPAATPGVRLMSNMAPTVAAAGDRRLAIGSPGADRITSALAISMILLVEGMTLEDAIEHPRCHYELDRGTVATEPGLDLDAALWAMRAFPAPDMYFGGVTGTEVSEGGVLGHADSRRRGGVASGGHP